VKVSKEEKEAAYLSNHCSVLPYASIRRRVPTSKINFMYALCNAGWAINNSWRSQTNVSIAPALP
jgi:hypothetical protein